MYKGDEIVFLEEHSFILIANNSCFVNIINSI